MSRVTKVAYILIAALCVAICTVAMVSGLPSYGNVEAHAAEETLYYNYTLKFNNVVMPFVTISNKYGATDNLRIYYIKRHVTFETYTITYDYELINVNGDKHASGVYTVSDDAGDIYNYIVNSGFEKALPNIQLSEETVTVAGRTLYPYFITDNATTDGENYFTINVSTLGPINMTDYKFRITPTMLRQYSSFTEDYLYETGITNEQSITEFYLIDAQCTTSEAPLYTITTSEDKLYDNAYDAGYSAGYDTGIKDSTGYDTGYFDGYKVGNENGYNAGYEAGNDEGYSVGYNQGETIGYNSGYAAGEEAGYDTGYQKGSYDVNLSLTEVTATSIGAFSDLLMQLLNFEVAGISVWGILATVGGIIIIGIVIKLAT